MLDLAASNDTFLHFSRFSNHFRGLAPFEEVHFYNFMKEGSELYEAVLDTGINFLPMEIPQEINSDEDWQVHQINASAGTEVLYGITLTLGVVPTVLMVLWARFFISQWLPDGFKELHIEYP